MQDTFSLVRKGSKNKESEIKFRIRQERKEKREDGRGRQRAESYPAGQEAHAVRRSWDGERVMAGRGARQKGQGHSAQGKRAAQHQPHSCSQSPQVISQYNNLCILAWGVPWTEEPGRLQSMQSQRVRRDWEINTHATTTRCRQESWDTHAPIWRSHTASLHCGTICL